MINRYKRQALQSLIQFLSTLTAELIALGHIPSGNEAYLALLGAFGATLAIWAGSKFTFGGRQVHVN